MTDYERILIATDFSPTSEAAGRRGVEFARRMGARLLLLHVIAHFPEDVPVAPVAPEGADQAEFLRRHAQERLAAFAARIGCADAERNVVLTNEASKNEIVQAADEKHADLIVLGAHNREGVFDLLGSTAGAVVGRAHCDVLVVRAHRPA